MEIINIDKKIIGWRIRETDKPLEIRETHAPKRPLELPCDIHQATIKGESWTLIIGLLNDKPYEIMGGLSKHVEIPKKYKTGIIIKNPRKTVNSRYDLKFGEDGDEVLIKDVVAVFDNPNYGSLTRMLSTCLRHGVPVQYLTEQLQKDKDSDMFSFSKVISRVIKNYIKDGTTSAIKCDNCGSNDLVYQSGCPICKDCGYSKCG